MKVISLFDGIGGAYVALERAGFKDFEYFSYEIDRDARNVFRDSKPKNTKYLDNVLHFNYDHYDEVDLIIGGSPCNDLSSARSNRRGLEGEQSILFYKFFEILKGVKHKYFLLENVARMPHKDKEIITELLGVEPIRINSSLVSGALRDRLYWTNIPGVTRPKDKGIELQRVLTSGLTDRKKARALLASDSRPLTTPTKMIKRYITTGFTTLVFEDPKDVSKCRYFNRTELERLQTFPDGYTKKLVRNKAAKALGNSFTVDVIAHILKNIPKKG